MLVLIWVAIGGAIGASLRYTSVLVWGAILGGSFPFGTLFVNVVGSLIMGFTAVMLTQLPSLGDFFRPLVMVGILGGFTTFSSFSLDVMALLDQGRLMIALTYIGVSVLLSLVAIAVGFSVGRAVL